METLGSKACFKKDGTIVKGPRNVYKKFQNMKIEKNEIRISDKCGDVYKVN